MYKHILEVRRCAAFFVNYSFEEKNYQLWVVGDQKDIFCRTSPIHEYDQKLAKMAASALGEKDLLSCLDHLARAFLHTPNSANGLVVLNDCARQLRDILRSGENNLVQSIADRAEELLGPNLAVNFIKLRARAIKKMRLEYAGASAAASIITMAIALLILGLSGDLYAWDITFVSSSILLIISTLALALALATRLSSRNVRYIAAATASLTVVLGCSIFGLVLQDDYIAKQKREALARFGNGDYESAKWAIEPLESALSAAPRDFDLQLMLGRAYVRATYYEKAIHSLKLAVDLSGGRNAEAHNELGLALLGKGDRVQAIEHFRRAIALRAPDLYEDAYQNLARGLGMVYLPGATFLMGRSDGSLLESPAHAVDIQPFFIDRWEVTNKDYLEFTRATKRPAPPQWPNGVPVAGSEDIPVVEVSLEDARAFARWRGKRDGLALRLPNESEWEFAARGKQDRRFPWGNEWKNSLANVRGDEGKLEAVGSYPKGATPEGVEDLLGNAAEWIDEQLRPYAGSPATIKDGLWVVRGGAYDNWPNQISATMRAGAPATGGDYHNIGFRCALSCSTLSGAAEKNTK
jgi:formylglycine-generating enzyme required for sulfatase activity